MEFGNWPTRLDTSTNNSLEKYKIQAGEILQIVPGKIKKEILKVFKIWKKSRMNQNCINCFSSWNFCFQSLATVLESQEAYSDSNPRILTLDEFEETRQSKQCGFSIYTFDNLKSKSMVRLVRAEKMVLSGLVFA